MAGIFNSAIFNNAIFNTGAVAPAGGDSTRLRRRPRGKRKWRYWWERDEPEEILVLSPEEALLDPVTVEALWEEKAHLNDYIIEMSVARVSQAVVAKLLEVNQYLQARIDVETAETTRKRRRKKALFLLLGGD